VGVAQLLVALRQREQRPQGEQHHRDQEGREIADAAVPELMLRSGPHLARRPPTSSIARLPESATEWNASASIDDAPVNAKPRNLATAMPSLARSAAMTALVPCPHRYERRTPPAPASVLPFTSSDSTMALPARTASPSPSQLTTPTPAGTLPARLPKGERHRLASCAPDV
jgi:hypothetical protein